MMSAQLVSIIIMFISGIAVGAAIDGTRTILGQVPFQFFHKIALLVEWLVWLFLAISTFYLLFLIKGGQWRFVDPLAQILGIISYELIFQNITRFIGRIIVNIFIRPLCYVGHVIFTIFRKFIRILMNFGVFITNPIFKIINKFLGI